MESYSHSPLHTVLLELLARYHVTKKSAIGQINKKELHIFNYMMKVEFGKNRVYTKDANIYKNNKGIEEPNCI